MKITTAFMDRKSSSVRQELSTPKDSLPDHSVCLSSKKYTCSEACTTCMLRQGMAIMVTSICSNSKSRIIAPLTGKQKYSSKFSSSNSLITPLIKNFTPSGHQTFAPYSIYLLQVCLTGQRHCLIIKWPMTDCYNSLCCGMHCRPLLKQF